ncbi:MAG: hypothetical protein ACKO04_15320 [Actinomycetes bacterium]
MRPGRAAAAALLVMGAVLLGAGCSQDDGPPAPRTTTTQAGPPASLPFTNVSQAELARQTGLAFPDGTADFLTAQLQNRSQLDVTFTLPPEQVSAFLAGSGLPDPVAGRRVVTHTSPLWKLNVDGELRGATRTVTTPEGVRLRLVLELVEEPGGRTRVRLVVTPR